MLGFPVAFGFSNSWKTGWKEGQRGEGRARRGCLGAVSVQLSPARPSRALLRPPEL